MSSMIPQAFVRTRIQPMLEPTSPIALLSLAVRKWIVVLNSPMSDMCRHRQTWETSVCRNAEHKVCSIVYRPRAPQETIAPMVRATRPPARRPRGHRCGHVPHVFRAMVSLGNNRGDASMPHELRPRSLARADRHARIILTYEAAGRFISQRPPSVPAPHWPRFQGGPPWNPPFCIACDLPQHKFPFP